MADKKKNAPKKKPAAKATQTARPKSAARTPSPKAEKTNKTPRQKLGMTPYVLAALAIFILVTLFLQDAGFLGSTLRPVFFGLFGGGAYVLPVYLLYLAIFWKRDHENGASPTKYLLCVVNFLFVLTIIHYFTYRDDTLRIADLYDNGVMMQGAGAFGGTVGGWLIYLFGAVATMIFAFLLGIVSLIFLLGSTPARVVRAIASFFKKVTLNAVVTEDDTETDGEKITPLPVETDSMPPHAGTTPVHRPPAGRVRPAADRPLPPDIEQISEDVEKAGRKTSQEESARAQHESRRDDGTVISGVPINRTDPFGDALVGTTVTEAMKPAEAVAEKAADVPEKTGYTDIFQDREKKPTPLPETDEKLPGEAELSLQKQSETAKTDESGSVAGGEAGAETTPVQTPPPEEQYVFPPLTLLSAGSTDYLDASAASINETGQKLVKVLETYGVKSKLVSTSCGPAVTRYELQPDSGVRVSKFATLSDDIRMRMATSNVRIETNIPGKSAVGIELPNEHATIVKLRDLIANPQFQSNKSKLYVCLGVDVGGNPVYFDIPDMPHLLIAGATGMGKSVCINSLIVSLLYRATPDEVKFILIDPKKIELSCYNGIPHLLVPVVNEPRKAAGSLNWAVVEMERRYTLMQEVGDARNLKEYNTMVEGDPERQKLPSIVIIIDELADLIMSAPDEVETSICRLAQKARAAGIYLIIGTQRPSVDVITGLIKANIPSRIAFTVSSQVDSRTILDIGGAEKLLGKGDMLYSPVKALKPIRVQGSFVDGKEVSAVCNFLKSAAEANYSQDVIQQIEEEAKQCGEKASKHSRGEGSGTGGDEKEDPLFLDAIGVAFEYETMSTSLLQRKLSVGYARAQKIIDMMEDRGYVGKFDPATKKRKINITFEEYQQLRLNKGEEGSAE